MDHSKSDRKIEALCPIKHKKCSSYQFDTKINSKFTKLQKKDTRNSFIDSFTPLESVLAVSQNREKLKSLYKTRLLPAQYLKTPSKVLEKLERNLYSSKELLTRNNESIMPHPKRKLAKSMSEKFMFKPGDNLNSHAILQDSCEKLIQDNKKYKKTLGCFLETIKKKDILREVLAKNEDDSEYKEFRSRLQRAKTIIKAK